MQYYKIVPIGSWEKLYDGSDGIIISYGYLLNEVINAKQKLAKNYNLGVINARFQKPIDEKMFNELLNKYQNIFICEEQTIINSLGEYLVNYANDKGYKGNIKVFAIPDNYIEQGSKQEILKELRLDAKSLVKRIK